ncbi:MAG: hypothetical protein LIP09_01060 [Bacteroidales bacterium]|nr:hypothetical protein [Bacteroidales bacterium]
MKKYFNFIIIMILTLPFVVMFSSCSHRNQAWETMDKAEEVMNSNPDSALTILSSIDNGKLGDDAEMARYALLKSMALDKNYIDTTNFDILQPAIDYFLSKGSADDRLRTYYYQGRIYQNQKNNDLAMRSFIRGREYFGQASDTLAMANLLVAQGTILTTTYKFEDFVNVNLEAAKLYSELNRVEYEILSIANALDGCIVMGNRDRADSIMTIAQNKTSANPEYSSEIQPYLLSYTIKFGDKEDITELLNYYDSVDTFDDMTKVDVAQAYCKIGDMFMANQILNAIDSSSAAMETLKYLAVKTDICEQSGDYEGALTAYKNFSTTIDSIHQGIFSHDLLFAKERHEMEKSNLLKLQKRDKIIWISICVAFVLLIIIGFIYYRYRLSKAKNLIEEQDLRIKIGQLEAESASLKEILEKRKDLAKPIEDAIKIRVEILNGLLATQITGNDAYAKPYGTWRDQLIQDKDEFMNSTRLAFKASHPRFIEYLEEHGLTESEINYVCLYAIGLRGKEVGEYMQLKRHYHISSDIRKKLGIDEHQTNIGIYIRKLMKKL